MSFLSRLQRVEAAVAAGCPVCRDMPDEALVVGRQEGLDGQPELQPGYEPPLPCPSCGREPAVVEVVEMLVRDRADVEELIGRGVIGRGRQ